MIRKIAIDQLVVGMYVHDLNCSWIDHPFLASRFLVKDAALRRKVVEAGVTELYIDTSAGRDVEAAAPAAPPPAAARDANANPANSAATAATASPAGAAPAVVKPAPFADEVRRARRLHGEAHRLVSEIMHDVRLGRQIEVERCQPIVDNILDSIFRLPGALLPLAQVKTRDEYTFQHCVAVAALAVAFGRTLDMSRDEIRELAMGGLLHDAGKARVPLAVLNKPGKLTDSEFVVMREHAAHGAELLMNTRGVSDIAYLAAAQHHERYDGSGYPQGLKQEAISVYGQMMAIVDVYDAITSLRVYHRGLPATEALRKMFEWSKCHFNPRLVQAFIKSIGIYPAGSLVRLESGRLGIVREVVPEKLLQPVVKVFFDADALRYLPPKTVDLSASQDKIVAHESYETWGIDQGAWL